MKKSEDIKLIKETKIIQKLIGFGIFLIHGSKSMVNNEVKAVIRAREKAGYFPARLIIKKSLNKYGLVTISISPKKETSANLAK